MDDTTFDIRFRHPFTCLIAGPTGCGKTVWLSRLIKHSNILIDPPPENIVWFYGTYQPMYDALLKIRPDIRFVEDLPEHFDTYIKSDRRNLFIIDDLMSEVDARVSQLFTRGSHHKNLSVILVLQNLFQHGKTLRTISLNAHYVVLFKNPRDVSVVSNFARQVSPGCTKFIQEAYQHATSRPYGYLVFDFTPNADDRVRYRTDIMPEENEQRISVYGLKKVNRR